MKRPGKIPAGALQLVLFVGAIIAVLLMSLVLLVHSHGLFEKRTDVLVELVRESDRGLRASFNGPVPVGAPLAMDGQGPLGITTEVERSHWGLLELRRATSKKGALSFEKIALVGPGDPDRPALYLRDDKRPLVLAGDTKIIGTAHLPERGVKMGNIYGQSYYADRLVHGREIRGSGELPALSAELRERLQWMLAPGPLRDMVDVPYREGMALRHSFKEATKVVRGDHLSLRGVDLAGNIIVMAGRKIVVEASSNLSDVVLIAPVIEVRDWTRGNFQALAGKQILIGKECDLEYPTLLAVHEPKRDSTAKREMAPKIMLDSYTELRGAVIHLGAPGPERHRPHVHIAEHATVVGEVYSSHNVELKGSVLGNVTTGGFVAIENGNIYQNHLYNGTIDQGRLPGEYAGLAYAGSRTDKIMKWLY